MLTLIAGDVTFIRYAVWWYHAFPQLVATPVTAAQLYERVEVLSTHLCPKHSCIRADSLAELCVGSVRPLPLSLTFKADSFGEILDLHFRFSPRANEKVGVDQRACKRKHV